jgi:ankyrin repeat protein
MVSLANTFYLASEVVLTNPELPISIRNNEALSYTFEIINTITHHKLAVSVQPSDFGSPLDIACEFGQTEVVLLFLEHGASLNSSQDPRAHVLLSLAVYGEHTDAVKVPLPTSQTNLPLDIKFWLCAFRSLLPKSSTSGMEVLEKIMRYTDQLALSGTDWRYLFVATFCLVNSQFPGEEGAIQNLLIEWIISRGGMDLKKKSNVFKALSMAYPSNYDLHRKFQNVSKFEVYRPSLEDKNISLSQILASNESFDNPISETLPLITAVIWHNELVIKTLIQHGADVNGCTCEGISALLFACLLNAKGIICTLLKSGQTSMPARVMGKHLSFWPLNNGGLIKRSYLSL